VFDSNSIDDSFAEAVNRLAWTEASQVSVLLDFIREQKVEDQFHAFIMEVIDFEETALEMIDA